MRILVRHALVFLECTLSQSYIHPTALFDRTRTPVVSPRFPFGDREHTFLFVVEQVDVLWNGRIPPIQEGQVLFGKDVQNARQANVIIVVDANRVENVFVDVVHDDLAIPGLIQDVLHEGWLCRLQEHQVTVVVPAIGSHVFLPK